MCEVSKNVVGIKLMQITQQIYVCEIIIYKFFSLEPTFMKIDYVYQWKIVEPVIQLLWIAYVVAL